MPKKSQNSCAGQVAGPDAQVRLDIHGQVEPRSGTGGGVHDRPGRVDPGELRPLRAVERQDRQRGVRLLDLGEPLLPAQPHLVQLVEAVQAVEAA